MDPSLITANQSIYEAMIEAGFFPARPERSGIYSRQPSEPGGNPHPPTLDLIAPESVAGSSRSHRGARIAGQNRRAVSKADGLELALLDYKWRTLRPIDPTSSRLGIEVKVAGPAALLCAKAWKLAERVRDADAGKPWRLREKDAGDIWQLMRVADPAEIRDTFDRHERNPLMGSAISAGRRHLFDLFGPTGRGQLLAARSLANTRTEREVNDLVENWMAAFVR